MKIAIACTMFAYLGFFSKAQAAEPYGEMLEQLRSQISAKIPSLDDAARKGIIEAKDAKARVEAVKQLAALDPFLADNKLDAKLAKFFILHDATPVGLTAFAAQGAAQKKMIDDLLANDALILQIAVADGARPVHGKDGKSPANYGKAMEIYSAIQQASPKANTGVLQRLALATSL